MNSALDGKWYRSEAFTYALSDQKTVKLDFLAGARHMAAPEVAEIIFRFSGTVGAVSGGALGRDAAKLFDTIKFTDEAEVISASGAGLRVLEQVEYGSKQVDVADISSGATNTSYVYHLRICFDPLKAMRGRDYRIPLEHFLEGGNLEYTTPTAVPTGWAAVQSDQRVKVGIRVVDGRTRELKSRMVIREQSVSSQEFDYDVSGSVRAAILTSKLTTTGYTTLAAYTTLFSRTLELPPAFETSFLKDRYNRFSDAIGSNDEFNLAAPGAIALVTPDRFQKVGAMIDTKTLHLDLLTTAPSGGKLLTCVIKDRTPNLAAMVAGQPSVADYQNAMRRHGRVVDGKPGGSPVDGYHPMLVRRMPVRLVA